jgi:MoxR-like ATPase
MEGAAEAGCRLQEALGRLGTLREEIHRVVVGLEGLIDGLLIGLLCGGHVLLEGVPGLAKTLCAVTLAQAIGATFRRVQFTPDLLPSDLIGSEVYNPRTGEFMARIGPVAANLVLADEVNRAPAKVQSALLEAMQERQVTIGGRTAPLPEPFMVIATQNPIEQEGTYPLPEAQVDRFLLKLTVPYPSHPEELAIVGRMATSQPQLSVARVLSPRDVLALRRVADRIHVDDRVTRYVLALVRASRDVPPDLELDRMVEWGASPRASICAVMAARARALLAGRDYVTPDDVKAIAPDVLRHRIALTFEAEAEGVDADHVVHALLDHIAVP